MTGTHARSHGQSRAFERSPRHQSKRYPPRHRAGPAVSRFGRRALRQYGRTATEARVRSPSEESAFQAETERWSGIRTRDTMINSHLLYPSELSLWSKRSESNRCLRVSPMLSMSYILHLRMAEHETGDRIAPAGISASPDPRPKRRSALIDEAICDCKWRRGNFSQDGRRL